MIAFLIIKTIILLGLAGYQIIITILALRPLLPSYLSYPARPRCTQIWVYPRTFMTLRVAQFCLKIAHLSFSMGPRGPRAYAGLRPRFSRGNKYLFWSIFVSMPDGVRRSFDLYCPIRKNYELARKNERSVFKF